MFVELTMNVSILSLRWLSDPVKTLSALVTMRVVQQDNLVPQYHKFKENLDYVRRKKIGKNLKLGETF